MRRIFIDRDKCEGCLGCTVACMAEHNPAGKSVYDVDMASRNNAVYNNVMADTAGKPVPVFCRHCDDPDCVRACMSGAMTKDAATGYVLYDRERCAACYMCLMSCRFGVLKTDGDGEVIQKCDFCGDRETPRCAEECPAGALECKEVTP